MLIRGLEIKHAVYLFWIQYPRGHIRRHRDPPVIRGRPNPGTRVDTLTEDELLPR